MDLLRAADLAGLPAVFAYDVAWEPAFGYYGNRRKFGHLFDAWIGEQYGSLEHAAAVWGLPVPMAEGRVAGPADDQLVNDGPHRVMVAAYRRFADDLISRRYREVVRLIRTIDDTHLIGARTGYGGTGSRYAVAPMQYQLTSGAAHLDFLSPEGWGVQTRDDPRRGLRDAVRPVGWQRKTGALG